MVKHMAFNHYEVGSNPTNLNIIILYYLILNDYILIGRKVSFHLSRVSSNLTSRNELKN